MAQLEVAGARVGDYDDAANARGAAADARRRCRERARGGGGRDIARSALAPAGAAEHARELVPGSCRDDVSHKDGVP